MTAGQQERLDGMAYDVGPCKSCHASVRWATTNSGKPQPLDLRPHEAGNVVLVDVGHETCAVVLSGPVLDRARLHGVELWVPHHATCPLAHRHRRRGAK